MSWTGGPRSYIVYAGMDTDEDVVLTVEDTRDRAFAYDGHGYVFGYDMVEEDGRAVAINEAFLGETHPESQP